MGERRSGQSLRKLQRQERKRNDQQSNVHEGLSTPAGQFTEAMGVDVPNEKRRLEEEDARGPHGGGSPEARKHHLPNHRLAPEQKKRAEEKRGSEPSHPKTIHRGRQLTMPRYCVDGRDKLDARIGGFRPASLLRRTITSNTGMAVANKK